MDLFDPTTVLVLIALAGVATVIIIWLRNY
jgi:hypothetical protein